MFLLGRARSVLLDPAWTRLLLPPLSRERGCVLISRRSLASCPPLTGHFLVATSWLTYLTSWLGTSAFDFAWLSRVGSVTRISLVVGADTSNYTPLDWWGMRLLSAYHEGLPHSLTVDYPSNETCGTKGSALCGALPSTPPVEFVGECSSWDASLSWECFVHPSRCSFSRWMSQSRMHCSMSLPYARLLLIQWKDSCSLPSPLGGRAGTFVIYKMYWVDSEGRLYSRILFTVTQPFSWVLFLPPYLI